MNLRKLFPKTNSFVFVSFVYIIATFVIKGISFITTPIFTRLMSTYDYGIISNFMMWAQFFATFFCFQLSAGLLSARINYATERFDSYMASIIRICIIVGFSWGVVICILSGPISGWISLESSSILPLCIFAFGICCSNLYSNYCIADGRTKEKVFFSIASSLVIVVLGIIFVTAFNNKSWGRVISYAISYAIIILFVLVYFLRKPFSKIDIAKKDIRFAVGYGLPLIPHLMANLINGNADRVFIIKYLGESQAGIYSVAYNIGVIVLVLADACNDAWNPWYYKKSRSGDVSNISKHYKIYSVTLAMCFFGIMMLAPEIMRIMAGSEYWSGISCIRYVTLGIFFLFTYRFPVNYEQLSANTKFIAPTTIVAALINLGLNALLIPMYGIDGAAIATTLSYIVLWLLHEIVARKIIKRYDIALVDYIPSILVAFLGFVASKYMLSYMLSRYIFIVVCCGIYLLWVMRLLKNKNE